MGGGEGERSVWSPLPGPALPAELDLCVSRALSLPGAGRLSEAGGGGLAARKGGAARRCRATL